MNAEEDLWFAISELTTAAATTTPVNNDFIGWTRKKNRAARAARTLAEFFACLPNDNVKFKVLTTTGTCNSISFILFIYFNDASTSPFEACSVNN